MNDLWGQDFTEDNFRDWCERLGGEYDEEQREFDLKLKNTGRTEHQSGLKQRCNIVLQEKSVNWQDEPTPTEKLEVTHDQTKWRGQGEVNVSIKMDDGSRYGEHHSLTINRDRQSTRMPDGEVVEDVPSIDGIELHSNGIRVPMKSGRQADWDGQGGPVAVWIRDDEVVYEEDLGLREDDPRRGHLQ